MLCCYSGPTTRIPEIARLVLAGPVLIGCTSLPPKAGEFRPRHLFFEFLLSRGCEGPSRIRANREEGDTEEETSAAVAAEGFDAESVFDAGVAQNPGRVPKVPLTRAAGGYDAPLPRGTSATDRRAVHPRLLIVEIVYCGLHCCAELAGRRLPAVVDPEADAGVN